MPLAGASAGRGVPRGSGRPVGPLGDDAWQTWWALNRLDLLPDRAEGFRRQTVTPGDAPRGGEDATGAWTAPRVDAARREVVPFLLRLVAPEAGARDDVVASALLALGKVSADRVGPMVLVRHLEDERASAIVRESAALGLGLLARESAGLRRDALELESVREALLAVADDPDAAARLREIALLAIGLLGDQPFAEPYGKDGRLMVRALWTRVPWANGDPSRTVALLTALGMQPPAGVPDAVREDLRRVVAGQPALGRRYDPLERSHALAAALRLGGRDLEAVLVRTIARRAELVPVRRAAYLGLGTVAGVLTSEERANVARVLAGAVGRDRDPLTEGLGWLGLGHLLGADLREGSERVLVGADGGSALLSQARSAPAPVRGFPILALGLALRGLPEGDAPAGAPAAFAVDAATAILRGLDAGRGDDALRAAWAVAAGLGRVADSVDPLSGIVADASADPELRGHAAVALGQIGVRAPEAERALFVALAAGSPSETRRQAALGLALLGGRRAEAELLRELRSGTTELHLAQVVIALGRLGDLGGVAPLLAHAADSGRSELSQALAVVALGMLADPEPRPLLLRLTAHANYPARTAALHEVFTIL